MFSLIFNRVLWMIPTLLVISFVSFTIIELPPGDYLTSYIAALEESGQSVSYEQVEALRSRYHLDQPFIVRYFHWITSFVQGDFGMSFEWNRPVADVIGERIFLTMAISSATLIFTWCLAIPIGIYCAVRQYSVADYSFTFLGFLGLATPNFLVALIFMYLSYSLTGSSPSGLFSPHFEDAPWSVAKLIDLVKHIWIPVVVIGTTGTAALIRVMRGNLLDELRKLYVTTARAKGLPYRTVLLKYPVRVALNPLISTIGWLLPSIIGGEIIVAVVMGLPTTGPLLLQALLNQDMYLAGGMIMLLALLTMIGTLLSDLLLLWLDPRIRYEGR
jgi:peptide/nickel transport system permease protein